MRLRTINHIDYRVPRIVGSNGLFHTVVVEGDVADMRVPLITECRSETVCKCSLDIDVIGIFWQL